MCETGSLYVKRDCVRLASYLLCEMESRVALYLVRADHEVDPAPQPFQRPHQTRAYTTDKKITTTYGGVRMQTRRSSPHIQKHENASRAYTLQTQKHTITHPKA